MKFKFKTKNFMKDFAFKEIRYFFNKDPIFLDEETLLLEKNITCEEFFNFYYYSRSFERVYLQDEDLTEFDLTIREYKINKNSMTIHPFLSVALYYYLGLDKEKEITIIDPSAYLGDVLLEIVGFDSPYFMKNRFKLPIRKALDCESILPKERLDRKIVAHAIVQESREFKLIKENISYLAKKLRVSQFDFSWLDVKFKEDDFDYGVSQIPYFSDEEELESYLENFFFYDAIYMC
jgi:hypothetical protein